MLHHISIGVSDIAKSERFYTSVLTALGYKKVAEGPEFVGYGLEEGKDKFALKRAAGKVTPPCPEFHLAFAAQSRTAVDAFHAAAMASGATSDGAPGLRAHYGEN